MKKLFLSFCVLFGGYGLSAQELNCKVVVNGDAILTQQTSDKQVFVDMQNTFTEFLNNRRWTNDNFAPEEKIKCNLSITFTKSPQQNTFIGSAQLVVARPVFGSNYETVVLAYTDKAFNISFLPEDRQMIFSEQNFNSNITSILGFYAFIALGFDYDSYSKLGGTPYFQRALVVANIAANASQSGWQQQEDQRNRYWLAENMMSQQLIPFREGMYSYHRQVLDNLSTDANTPKKPVLDILNKLRDIQTQKNNSSVVIYSFFDAKGRELVNMFSESSKEERLSVFNSLSTLDPAQTEYYRKLVR